MFCFVIVVMMQEHKYLAYPVLSASLIMQKTITYVFSLDV